MSMDVAAARAAFDAQVRRSTAPDGSGSVPEADGPVVRWLGRDGRGWSGIAWSQLDESNADAVIATQVAHFASHGQPFEWKLYDYDAPASLAARLIAAGFTEGEPETLMAALAREVAAEPELPDGVSLAEVTGEAGVDLLVDVHERVFGGDHARLRRSLLAQHRAAPDAVAMVVALAGREPVCAARIEFGRGTGFAGLWGGGTLPGWRGRGVYRALVAYRAAMAAARGYRYLHVEAMPDSQPILARLGFRRLAATTGYLWRPELPPGGEPG